MMIKVDKMVDKTNSIVDRNIKIKYSNKGPYYTKNVLDTILCD